MLKGGINTAKTSKEEQLIKRGREAWKCLWKKRISQFCSFPTEPKESEKIIFQDDLKNVWTGKTRFHILITVLTGI